MERLLNEEIVKALKEKFSNLEREVKILFYKGGKCEYCKEIEQLIKEISETSEKISYDIRTSNKGPYLTFEGYENIQYWGIPSGYEFRAFVDTIEMIGKRVSYPFSLAKKISEIKNVKIMTFVTPQCPYCPQAVIMANKMAIFNKNIKSITIEAIEFPGLSEKYKVMAVPKTIVFIEEKMVGEWEGMIPEKVFVEKICELFRSNV